MLIVETFLWGTIVHQVKIKKKNKKKIMEFDKGKFHQLGPTQLFQAQIYPIKAVLRCKNFKSADPTQFLRYNQNKNCSETSIS